MATSVSVLAPGLLGHPSFAEAMANISLPGIEQLFDAIIDTIPASDRYDQQLLSLLGANVSPDRIASLAKMLASETGGKAQKASYLIASFVHLQADSGRLIMFGDDQLEVDESETQQWLGELEPLFEEHHIKAEAISPEHWLITSDKPLDSTFSPLSQVVGKDIHDFMPKGANAMYWRSLMNEIQMQLHLSSENNGRQVQRRKVVNSMWLWGSGEQVNTNNCIWQGITTDDVLARLLAQRIGIGTIRSLKQGDDLLNRNNAYQIIVDTSMAGPTARQDVDSWYQYLELFQATVAAPIIQALKSKEIKEVQLYPINGRAFRLRVGGFNPLRNFFGKRKHFVDYMAEV